jgi:ATP-dependent Clp protease ATP-binding subunit ClpC
MNESTLTQLKIIVERAIRPVRAGIARKRKMREELLAHVVGVFEEEAARLGDDRVALERTALRFGNPAEVTIQLQESVPTGDRSGASALWRAAQLAAAFGALGFVPLGIGLLIHGPPRGSEWLTVPLMMAFLAFCSTLLTHGMRQSLLGPAGPSWLRVGLVAAAAWPIISVTAFAIGLTEMADIQKTLWEIVPLLPQGVLAPVALVAVVYLYYRSPECRHDREWARLDID